jgi:hypothetical protein
MTPEFKAQFPDSLRTIYISSVETCDVNWFVNQYLVSRLLHANFHARNEVVLLLKDYPGQSPVRLYELNAWLDHNMISMVLRSPGIRSLRLVVDNERLSARPVVIG